MSARPISLRQAKLDWSWWATAPHQPEQSEKEWQEDQLREQIRCLRMDIEEDNNFIIDMSDVAGLESVKAALDEFAVR
jgi:hypothetical protein